METVALRLLVALLPVCLFLGSLVYMDSYKLVHLRTLLQLIGTGGAIAVMSFGANHTMFQNGAIDPGILTRFVIPLLEELLKAMPILWLLRMKRVGFLVDAAILGFATGAGFSLIENLYYLWALPDASLALWMVRGFGTAVMHGGTTAIMAMTTKVIMDRKQSGAWWLLLPGLAMAFAIHSLFNQFLLSPIWSAVLMIVALPPLLVLVFGQSERYLESWLGTGFDLDAELLDAMHSDEFSLSRVGEYLHSLRVRFEGPIVVDMLCYLRLHAELSLRAKGILMMRELGFAVEKDPEVEDKLRELMYLKKSIGKTGELALAPILHHSAHELWQLRMLETSDVSR